MTGCMGVGKHSAVSTDCHDRFNIFGGLSETVWKAIYKFNSEWNETNRILLIKSALIFLCGVWYN